MDESQEPQEADHGPMGEWPTGRLLSTASRLVEHAWLDALDELGLSHAGLIALHLLGEEPTNQTDLAARARVENQTMSRTLDRLEREGYILRERDARDRRRHIITRTPAGAAAWQSAKTLEADVFPEISDPQALRSALLELIHAGTARRWHP
ncbi:MAG: MarR family transcriptional regulator [Cryobacterium sp.]|nr:MarR family transcriptional regulator [Cryobacterium sp.]MBX3311038.1 MarR family transcriptional regulator [Cryobacterium sp.]MCB1280642.1 MarR family transcriptional regulator [Salinibacterium sp.]